MGPFGPSSFWVLLSSLSLSLSLSLSRSFIWMSQASLSSSSSSYWYCGGFYQKDRLRVTRCQKEPQRHDCTMVVLGVLLALSFWNLSWAGITHISPLVLSPSSFLQLKLKPKPSPIYYTHSSNPNQVLPSLTHHHQHWYLPSPLPSHFSNHQCSRSLYLLRRDDFHLLLPSQVGVSRNDASDL